LVKKYLIIVIVRPYGPDFFSLNPAIDREKPDVIIILKEKKHGT